MFTDDMLVSDGFDEKAYLKHTLHLPSREGEHSRIQRCIQSIDVSMRQKVGTHYDSLLSQSDTAISCEKRVDSLKSSVSALESSSKRLMHVIEEPFVAVEAQVNELENITHALDVIRKLQRFISLTTKLKELSAAGDVTRAARVLKETEVILASRDWKGIEAVDRRLDTISELSAATRSKAHDLLRSGLANHNQTDVGCALQCFFSLGSFERIVTSLIGEQKRETVKLIVKELDPMSITEAISRKLASSNGGSSSGGSKEGTVTREVVFARLDSVFSDIILRCGSLSLLFNVITRKRDPTTHAPFSTALKDDRELLREYWSTVLSQLQEKLRRLHGGGGQHQQQRGGNLHLMLTAEYPRYYQCISTFSKALSDFFSLFVRSGEEEEEEEGKGNLSSSTSSTTEQRMSHEVVAGLTGDLENAFTSYLLDRVGEKYSVFSNKVSSLIPSMGTEAQQVDIVGDPSRGPPPAATALDVRGLIKVIHHEVAANRHDAAVIVVVLKAALHLLGKIHQRLSECCGTVTLPPLPSIVGSVTNAQLCHICCANAASVVSNEFAGLLGVLPHDDELVPVMRKITHKTTELSSLSNTIVSKFFESATRVISQSVESVVLDSSSSPLPQLQNRTHHFSTRFVHLFDKITGVNLHEIKMAKVVILSELVKVISSRPYDLTQLQEMFTRYNSCIGVVSSTFSPGGRVDLQTRALVEAVKNVVLHQELDDEMDSLLEKFSSTASSLLNVHTSSSASNKRNAVDIVKTMMIIQRAPPAALLAVHTFQRKQLRDFSLEVAKLFVTSQKLDMNHHQDPMDIEKKHMMRKDNGDSSNADPTTTLNSYFDALKKCADEYRTSKHVSEGTEAVVRMQLLEKLRQSL